MGVSESDVGIFDKYNNSICCLNVNVAERNGLMFWIC